MSMVIAAYLAGVCFGILCVTKIVREQSGVASVFVACMCSGAFGLVYAPGSSHVAELVALMFAVGIFALVSLDLVRDIRRRRLKRRSGC